jgi:RNA-directed DNA polymerase
MQRKYPTIPFERYADDAICHCASEAQALELRQALEQRFAARGLRLHREKTAVCRRSSTPRTPSSRAIEMRSPASDIPRV